MNKVNLSIITMLVIIPSIGFVVASNSVYDDFKTSVESKEFNDFAKQYRAEIMDCGNVWKVHSSTVCYQTMITHYQNQVIINELKKLNEAKQDG